MICGWTIPLKQVLKNCQCKTKYTPTKLKILCGVSSQVNSIFVWFFLDIWTGKSDKNTSFQHSSEITEQNANNLLMMFLYSGNFVLFK